MVKRLSNQGTVWLLLGIVVGVGIAAVVQQPARGSATDHSDKFAIATGFLQPDLEAVYILDFTTGRLVGTVMNNQTGQFDMAAYRDLAQDFGLTSRSKPEFVMVTGRLSVATARIPVNHALYVAEMKSGRLAAYFIPWNGAGAGNVRNNLQMQLLRMTSFRNQG